jgi:hypothetical protein
MVEPTGTCTPHFVILTEFRSHELSCAHNQILKEQKLRVLEYGRGTCSNHGKSEKGKDLILIEQLSFP